MKTKLNIRRGFTLVELLVVIVIIAALAGLTAPQVIKMKKKGDLAEATNNAKQMGLAFMQFDADIGSYPDNDTATDMKNYTGQDPVLTPLSGTNSNDYFRQFIEAGIVESEQPFFAKTSYTKKPDDVKSTSTEALAAGEVGFGYIMNGDSSAITGGSGRPVCVTPLKENVTDGTMETEPYDGKAIVLFTDNSVRQLNIQKTGSKAILSGKTLLATGSDTVWGTDITPTIKAPKP